jgi:hypothetical protein
MGEVVTAADVLSTCENAASGTQRESAIGSMSNIKEGDEVKYKAGHRDEGMVGRVAGLHPERNMVDLKVGNATRVDVPISDLLRIDRQPSS